jgi:hypothetical protein
MGRKPAPIRRGPRAGFAAGRTRGAGERAPSRPFRCASPRQRQLRRRSFGSVEALVSLPLAGDGGSFYGPRRPRGLADRYAHPDGPAPTPHGHSVAYAAAPYGVSNALSDRSAGYPYPDAGRGPYGQPYASARCHASPHAHPYPDLGREWRHGPAVDRDDDGAELPTGRESPSRAGRS